ncbi:MAG: OmpA family protein [Rhodobacteraceae bacterium]|nr:OmpA family protein [Paracoccaceae bacterium]
MRFTTTMLGLSAGLFLVTACVPAGQYDPNDPNARTRNGALIGAGLGALAGVATGDGGKNKLDRAAVGAVLGGLAGGIYGNVLDKQAAELQRDITTNGVRIVNEGNQLRVIMPEGILFPVDSAAVNPGIMNDLYTVADSLNRYPGSRVQVVGHTDNTGSAAYNADLSQRRAGAVANVLRGAGVSGARLNPVGMGEDQPIASNLSPAGRAQNRRVEIVIIPTN